MKSDRTATRRVVVEVQCRREVVSVGELDLEIPATMTDEEVEELFQNPAHTLPQPSGWICERDEEEHVEVLSDTAEVVHQGERNAAADVKIRCNSAGRAKVVWNDG